MTPRTAAHALVRAGRLRMLLELARGTKAATLLEQMAPNRITGVFGKSGLG